MKPKASWLLTLLAVCMAGAMLAPASADAAGRSEKYGIHVRYVPLSMHQETEQERTLGAVVARRLTSALFKEFPCASVQDDEDDRALLGFFRMAAMLGTPGADEMGSDSLVRGIRHLVLVKASPSIGSSGMYLSLVGLHYRNRKAEARAAGPVQSLPDGEALIREFVKELAKTEVCPYTGQVTVLIESTRSKKSEDSHGTYCNKLDQRFRKTESQVATTSQDWKLVKTGRIDTTEGAIKLSTTERIETTEEDDCAVCTPQRQAGQISSTETSIRARFDSLSDVTRVPGYDNHDATVVIRFTDDDHFFIALKATTKKGTRSTDTTHRTEGACANPPPKRTRTSVEADVAIEEPSFGPFAGSPLDKRLKGKLEIPLNDPLIGETGMKTIEFDLRRD